MLHILPSPTQCIVDLAIHVARFDLAVKLDELFGTLQILHFVAGLVAVGVRKGWL